MKKLRELAMAASKRDIVFHEPNEKAMKHFLFYCQCNPQIVLEVCDAADECDVWSKEREKVAMQLIAEEELNLRLKAELAAERAKVAMLRKALDAIACWSDGPVVNSGFDDPSSAKLARIALAATVESTLQL